MYVICFKLAVKNRYGKNLGPLNDSLKNTVLKEKTDVSENNGVENSEAHFFP